MKLKQAPPPPTHIHTPGNSALPQAVPEPGQKVLTPVLSLRTSRDLERLPH